VSLFLATVGRRYGKMNPAFAIFETRNMKLEADFGEQCVCVCAAVICDSDAADSMRVQVMHI
jgi:hypothetical protein